MNPGKIPMIALCAVMLALLASCAVGRNQVPAGPDPVLSKTTTDAGQLLEIPPDQEQDSPELFDEPAEEPIEEPIEEPNPIPFFVPEPDDPDAVQIPEPVRVSIPIPFLTAEAAPPP